MCVIHERGVGTNRDRPLAENVFAFMDAAQVEIALAQASGIRHDIHDWLSPAWRWMKATASIGKCQLSTVCESRGMGWPACVHLPEFESRINGACPCKYSINTGISGSDSTNRTRTHGKLKHTHVTPDRDACHSLYNCYFRFLPFNCIRINLLELAVTAVAICVCVSRQHFLLIVVCRGRSLATGIPFPHRSTIKCNSAVIFVWSN